MPATPLTDKQRTVLEFLLREPFPGRDELARQAETARTTGPSCTCGCPSFGLLADRRLPPAIVEDLVPVEAVGHDPAGNLIGVLLFVRDGYLDDVEVYSLDASEFAGLPQLEALEIARWDAPDANGVRWLKNDLG